LISIDSGAVIDGPSADAASSYDQSPQD